MSAHPRSADDVPDGGEIGILDDRQVVGIESLRERCEADDVGEQHRDDPTLGPDDRLRLHPDRLRPRLRDGHVGQIAEAGYFTRLSR